MTAPLAIRGGDRNMARVIPFARHRDGRQAVNSAVQPAAAGTVADAGDDAQWAQWMVLAQGGDRAAYHALLTAIVPWLRSIARRYMRQEQDAEDMVQEILIVVHDIRHTYEAGRPFHPWLATIATRRCIDSLRRRMRRNLHELADEQAVLQQPDDAATPEGGLEREQHEREVRRAVAALPARQREAVELLRLRELSLEEAARESTQSVGSLKVAMHRAMKSLQRAMTGKESGQD
jgi:RNA polymerase sigma-70 factor (ECF subfamily)